MKYRYWAALVDKLGRVRSESQELINGEALLTVSETFRRARVRIYTGPECNRWLIELHELGTPKGVVLHPKLEAGQQIKLDLNENVLALLDNGMDHAATAALRQ